MLLLSSGSADFFFKIDFFKKNISGTPSECQMVWIQIRTNILSVLIWIQTVCKGERQMTSKERVLGYQVFDPHKELVNLASSIGNNGT